MVTLPKLPSVPPALPVSSSKVADSFPSVPCTTPANLAPGAISIRLAMVLPATLLAASNANCFGPTVP